MSEGKCNLCVQYGKPPFDSDPIRCAFPEGVFTGDNWNCATANAVRALAESELPCISRMFGNDQTWAFIPVDEVSTDDEHIVLAVSWYKRRGTTTQMFFLNYDDEGPIHPATIRDVWRVLIHYRHLVLELDAWLSECHA